LSLKKSKHWKRSLRSSTQIETREVGALFSAF
jgi:hypothetical protein